MVFYESSVGRNRGALKVHLEIRSYYEEVHACLACPDSPRRREQCGSNLTRLQRRPQQRTIAKVKKFHVPVGIQAKMAQGNTGVDIKSIAGALHSDNLSPKVVGPSDLWARN